MKKYFYTIFFLIAPKLASAGYVQEQGQYWRNLQVTNGEVSSFEMFVSLLKVTLAFGGLVFLVVMLYAGLHWLFTYGNKKNHP